jgi:hypothetical protein
MAKFADEAGDRTTKYIEQAGKAVYADANATLLEVILMLTSPAFRAKVVPTITNPRQAEIWRDFDNLSDEMQAVIAAPILN